MEFNSKSHNDDTRSILNVTFNVRKSVCSLYLAINHVSVNNGITIHCWCLLILDDTMRSTTYAHVKDQRGERDREIRPREGFCIAACKSEQDRVTLF